jgi:hypothetical protein
MADRSNDGAMVSEQARAAAHKLASTRPEDFAGGQYSAVRADAGGVVWSLIRTERPRRA